ncbi:hypothetical protein V5799_016643 [Amblyomma americanum]|uniref:Uncharacterized protein n=1 Tax=Amblyomma americanum TaxID=6943 RepID=A0AAQ4F4J3_AMBAM
MGEKQYPIKAYAPSPDISVKGLIHNEYCGETDAQLVHNYNTYNTDWTILSARRRKRDPKNPWTKPEEKALKWQEDPEKQAIRNQRYEQDTKSFFLHLAVNLAVGGTQRFTSTVTPGTELQTGFFITAQVVETRFLGAVGAKDVGNHKTVLTQQ